MIKEAEEKVCSGMELAKEELLALVESDPVELAAAADRIRAQFCGDQVEFCAIINAKNGRCCENCGYCAQSSFFQVKIQEYLLLNADQIVHEALVHAQNGVSRFSIVTSGRKASARELDVICHACEAIREQSSISLCASLGLLTLPELQKLKQSGLARYHHNLETSRRYFPRICTTHSYQERLETIACVQMAGLEICSGGIIGLGETWEDRIDLALELRRLHVPSVPVNVLNPIAGTPLGENKILSADDVRKTLALFRFILPKEQIRLAGGRNLYDDCGRSFFKAGANAAITGPMLTTSGISLSMDRRIINDLSRSEKSSKSGRD